MNKLSFWESLPFFIVPGALMAAGFYWVMPALEKWGVNLYISYSLALGLPLLLMLIASMVFIAIEGVGFTWPEIKQRFRLYPIKGRDWLWVGGVFIAEMALYLLVSRLTQRLISSGWIRLPEMIPAFVDPRTVFGQEALDQAAGGLAGNWPVLIVSMILLVINVLGEELWWRGMILPRQELALGAAAWVVHGLMWNFFHAYKYWDLISLLPLSLGLSFVVSKLRNTSAGILIHFITNGSGLIPIILGVLGQQ